MLTTSYLNLVKLIFFSLCLTPFQILELSSRYYQLIPYTDFAFDKMEPLNKLEALKDAEKNMQNLVDLELANRILLGAQYRIKGMC